MRFPSISVWILVRHRGHHDERPDAHRDADNSQRGAELSPRQVTQKAHVVSPFKLPTPEARYRPSLTGAPPVSARFVGYDRYTGQIAGQTLAHLYGAVRLYVNYPRSSFKLVETTGDGARVTKRYDKLDAL